MPRLTVQPSRGMSGEPVPLGLTIHGRAEGAVVIISGLPDGTDVSTGIEAGVQKWELFPNDVGYALVAPPQNHIGSADVVVELRIDDQIIDRQIINLEWASPTSLERSHTLAFASDRKLEAAVTPSSPFLAPEQFDQDDAATGPSATRKRLQFFSIERPAARITLKRAADVNDAEAVLALTSTYDPLVLRELRVYGFPADAAIARSWYEKEKNFARQ